MFLVPSIAWIAPYSADRLPEPPPDAHSIANEELGCPLVCGRACPANHIDTHVIPVIRVFSFSIVRLSFSLVEESLYDKK